MQLSQDAFQSVVELFERVSGIRYGTEKRQLVIGRLNRLAIESGAANLDEYVEVLLRERDPEEITRVVDRLTTNETYFFREPQHFTLLDELAQRHDRRRPFRVWSAASSSGEEAYSAAMVLADRLGTSPWEIVGTDLSLQMIQAARTALYPTTRINGISPQRLKRYCLKGQGQYDGSLLISRVLRERVKFQQANLMQALPPLGQFDVVFLRNVLIYFDADSKRAIVKRVAAHLAEHGLLFIGHAESLTNVTYDVAAVQPAVYEKAG
ncbi:MAG: protein-glutamate O-methyltransferase CheR [Burkholderiaceae bacterium]